MNLNVFHHPLIKAIIYVKLWEIMENVFYVMLVIIIAMDLVVLKIKFLMEDNVLILKFLIVLKNIIMNVYNVQVVLIN